jgi:beta-lactamase class D
MKHLTAVLFLLAPIGFAQSQELPRENRDDLARQFTAIGTEGTMVVRDPRRGKLVVVNAARAERGFLPASTFKIANALIALETSVVKDADNPVFKWDGKQREFEQWNKDHTLGSGFKVSAVWQFQEIARKIGVERMKDFVAQFGYGNGDISGAPPDAFWLDGNFRISAMQQVDFLTRFESGKLPVAARSAQIVREIMFLETIGDATLRGKTGWLPAGDTRIGWFVGWVERSGAVYVFALNLDPAEPRHVAARVPIAKAILAELGLIPKLE